MFKSNRPFLSGLDELAMEVSEGRLSLTQALALIESADERMLASRLDEACRNLLKHIAPNSSNLPFRCAFLELGTAAALKADSALAFLNFGMNLSHVLCMELDEVERGLNLMERAMQQIEAVRLEPSEVATVILEVADTYMTFHERMGPDCIRTAEEGYRVILQMPEAREFDPLLIARAESGLGLCLAEVRQDEHMVHAG